jgi:hypothetical protein
MGRSRKTKNSAKGNLAASKMLAEKVNQPNRQATAKNIRAAAHSRAAKRGG